MDYVEVALKDLEVMFRDDTVRDEMINMIYKEGRSLRQYVKLEILQGGKTTEHVSVPYNTGTLDILGGDIEVSIFHIPETIKIVSTFANIGRDWVESLPSGTVFFYYV